MEGEKYNLEKAQGEAEALRNKIDSGEAHNYSEAEQKIEKEAEDKVKELLDWVKTRQTEKLIDHSKDHGLGYVFLNDLLRQVSGYSGYTYSERDKADFLEIAKTIRKGAGYDERYSPEDLDTKLADFLKSKFDGMVLDLGTGPRSLGYALSNVLGARGYIGVENEFAASASTWCERYKGETPFVIDQEDMGKFLRDFRRTGEKMQVIIFSGVDRYSYRGDVSYDVLIERIKDVLSEDGILILAGNLGWMEEDYGKDIKKSFERIRGEWEEDGSFQIYARKKGVVT